MLEPPGTKPQEHPFLFHDGIGPRSGDRYDNWDAAMNYAPKTAQTNYGHDDEYASGVCSPPLWRTSPPRSPQHQRNHYRSLSPASRAQAIARGQRELMEMVRNMPESCYELSLKDLVEQPVVDHLARQQQQQRQSTMLAERDIRNDSQRKRNDFGNKGKTSLRRSVTATMDNRGGGFLLKMVFPLSFGSKRKKKMMMMKKKNDSNNDSSTSMANNNNTSAKVSPKPLVSEGSKGSSNTSTSVDKEWWKKRFSVSAESESGDQSSSSNSGSIKSSSGSRSSSISSRSSSSRHGRRGCWWFRGKKKSRDAE